MKRNLLAILLFSFFSFVCANCFAQITSNPYKAPLYWSVYEHHIVKEQNGVQDNYIPESEFLANINWVDKNLKDLGYKMICLDGWGDVSRINEYGYRTSHSRHWEHDYAWWSNHLQQRGMTLGMYGNPLWVHVDDNDKTTMIKGTNIPVSSLKANDGAWFPWAQVDRPGAEEYVKGYVEHFAKMGIKYFRVDFLSWFEDGQDRYIGKVGPNRPREHYETALRWMKEACDAHGIFLSLVMPHLYNEAELEQKYGHMIRINEDTGEGTWWKWSDKDRGIKRVGWSVYAGAVDGLTYWSYIAGKGKMILDPDFLRINTFANDEEKKSVVSLCLMAGAPVTVSDQYHTIGNNLWVYQNKELLALNAEGFVGKPLSNDPTNENSQIWKGQLANGDWVVGFFNRESSAKTRSIDFSSLGYKGEAYVRDLWQHNELGAMKSYSVSVPAHGCVIVKISKHTPAQVSGPSFSKPGAIHTTAQTITLSTATMGASIYFTLDGTTPTLASPKYKGPITVSRTSTIKAFAAKGDMTPSPVISNTYTINAPGPLPAPWQTSDIGTVGLEGSSSYHAGTFINTASGSDIEGNADAFRFIYQPIEGDATITARIATLSNTNDWTKAGVMIRESLDANAENAFLSITPSNGLIFQKRESTGGGTNGNLIPGLSAPVWVRVQRVGNEVTAFRSTDGIHWVQSGAVVNVSMGTNVYAGLAFTAHEKGTLGAASFDNVIVGHVENATAVPVFSLDPGTYASEQTVSLSTVTPGAVIHYTTNGTVPNESSPVYSGPIQVPTTTIIKAFSVVSGKVNSPVVSAIYTINAPNPAIVSGGIYRIRARHSGKVLDVSANSTQNGGLIHQWDGYDLPSQQWKIEYLNNGFYKLTAQHSEKVLDIAGGSINEDAVVHQWGFVNGASQQWVLKAAGDGSFIIENRNSSKVLSVSGASLENGAIVNQNSYTGGIHQQWQLDLLSAPPPPPIYVGGTFNGWNLSSTPMTLVNGVWQATGVQIGAGVHEMKFANTSNWSGDDWGNASGLSGTASLSTGGKPNISFTIQTGGIYTITFDPQSLAYAIVNESIPDGIYVIKARHSNKALDVEGGSKDDGALIHQWDNYSLLSQQWNIVSVGDGFYKIENRNSGKVLDVSGASQNEGAAVHQWQYYSSLTSQQWRLVDLGNGYFKIENRNSGKSLDVYGVSYDNGAKINQYTYTGGLNQQWSLELYHSSVTAPASIAMSTDRLEVSKASVDFQVYPNPAYRLVNIRSSGFLGKVEIINASGVSVYRGHITDPLQSIDVSSLPSGIYFIKVQNGKKASYTQRLVINK